MRIQYDSKSQMLDFVLILFYLLHFFHYKASLASAYSSNVMFCANWYHLYNLKNVKNTHGGVLLFSKIAG